MALIEMLIFICQLIFATRQDPESYLGVGVGLYVSGSNSFISHSKPLTHQSTSTFKCIPQHRSIVRHVLEQWLLKKNPGMWVSLSAVCSARSVIYSCMFIELWGGYSIKNSSIKIDLCFIWKSKWNSIEFWTFKIIDQLNLLIRQKQRNFKQWKLN